MDPYAGGVSSSTKHYLLIMSLCLKILVSELECPKTISSTMFPT